MLTGYWLTPRSLRNLFLLLASLFFYAWGEAFYVLIMLCSIAFNYLGGILIDRCSAARAKKLLDDMDQA